MFLSRKRQRLIKKKLLKKRFVLDKDIFVSDKQVRFWKDQVIVRCKLNDNKSITADLITENLEGKIKSFIVLSNDPFSATPFYEMDGLDLVFKHIEMTNRYVYISFKMVQHFSFTKQLITLKFRRLSSKWTVKLNQDLRVYYD